MNNGSITSILLAFVLYLGGMIFVGIVSFKRTKSTSDFFLAGRSLGPWFTALSAEASDMSAWLLMGLPGVAYLTGQKEAFWTAVGLLIGTYLNWVFVAKRLRKYTIHAGDSITIPEFLTNRFCDKSNLLNMLSSVMILFFFIFYTASGFVACAKLFSSVFGMPYSAALLLGVAIVLGYTLLGGFFAVCSTDFIQGSLMFIALVVTLISATLLCGGPVETAAKINALGAEFLNPFVSPKGSSFGTMEIISALGWGLGYFGMPHILVRFMAIRSNKEMSVSRRIAMAWVTISLAATLLIAVVGKVYLLPEVLSDPETIFIVTIQKIFPAFIGGLFLCSIFAASMSTADSQLLVAASAFSKDVYKSMIRKNASDKEMMFVSRLTVLAVAAIGVIIARNPESSIFSIVSYAWAGFGATFGPIIVVSLFWRNATRNGALAGMLFGGLTVIIWKQLSGGIFDLYEVVPGFIMGLIGMIIFSCLDKNKDPKMLEQFDNYNKIED